MKYLQIATMLVVISFWSAYAQPNPIPAFTPGELKNHGFVDQYSFSGKDFYGNINGAMHVLMSSDYIGSSLSYFPKTKNRLQYGLNAGIIPIVKNNNASPNYYLGGDEDRLLLIPFWLSVKIRLKTNYDDILIPYLIGGIGPTLGLDFGPYNGFFDSINHMRGELGGGGYIGFGVDYLWAEDWAFSIDVRYNLFLFDHPLGVEREFGGFSIFFGFVRAFGL